MQYKRTLVKTIIFLLTLVATFYAGYWIYNVLNKGWRYREHELVANLLSDLTKVDPELAGIRVNLSGSGSVGCSFWKLEVWLDRCGSIQVWQQDKKITDQQWAKVRDALKSMCSYLGAGATKEHHDFISKQCVERTSLSTFVIVGYQVDSHPRSDEGRNFVREQIFFFKTRS